MNKHNDSPVPGMDALLEVIRSMVGEVHPHWKNLHFTPDTMLERELGLDSMARAELHGRIKSRLGVQMADNATLCALTPADIMRAMEAGAERDITCDPAQDTGTAAAELLMGNFGGKALPSNAQTRGIGAWLYALYCWPVFVVLALVAWVLIVLTPSERARRFVARNCARLLFALTFTPFRVRGREHLDHEQAQIIVANHASYIDGFIVTAALDLPIHFIVKGELAGVTAIRILLERFGVEFVERFNANRGTSDVNRIADKVRKGQSIVFFPEGTFTTFAGLQPFRMGAFVTAARAGVPVVPVAIRGARSIVRGDHWFPYRGRIEVTVCPPVEPQGAGWDVALNLRNGARRALAPHTGEPDLVGNEY